MRERLRQGRTLLAASALAALVLLAAAQPPLPPLTATENRVTAALACPASRCRRLPAAVVLHVLGAWGSHAGATKSYTFHHKQCLQARSRAGRVLHLQRP